MPSGTLTLDAPDARGWRATLKAGLLGGLVGGVTIWLYEIVDQSIFRKVATPYQIGENTAVLALGPDIRSLGAGAFALGAAIHLATALAWGVLFAFLWPSLRRRGAEATLAGGVFGVFAWIVMHDVLLAAFSPDPPAYATLSVINGLMSQT